jgi:outer membrane biosynthesis protein TonB
MTNGTRERARSFLLYGFAISMVVHLTVLPFVHRVPTAAADETPPDVVHRDPMPTPPPTPRPTPPPPPTAQPTPPPHDKPQTPQPQRPPLRINAPHQDSQHHGGNPENPNAYPTGNPNGVPHGEGTAAPLASAVPAAAATATPTPHPTPTPLSCARPNVPATTLHALEPETPAMAAQQGISGTVSVVVSLDAQSRVVATRVQSSPSALLNQPALAAARGSQFRTEVKNCEPIAADYLFSVEFTAQ